VSLGVIGSPQAEHTRPLPIAAQTRAAI
jgi:hypothetical protein